jgi:hypothetical protein
VSRIFAECLMDLHDGAHASMSIVEDVIDAEISHIAKC